MKYIVTFFVAAMSFVSCNSDNSGGKTANRNNSIGRNADTLYSGKGVKLPFVGVRGFETRPGVSGTGTPHRFIKIMKNGDVFFSFEQENQADKTVTEETYYAGKFKQYMKCFFKKLDNEKSYYEIAKDTIYETDEHNKRLKSNDCCEIIGNLDNQKCGCKGAFFLTE